MTYRQDTASSSQLIKLHSVAVSKQAADYLINIS